MNPSKTNRGLKQRFKSVTPLVIYLLLMILSAYIFSQHIDRETLQSLVKTAGLWGILLYFLISVVYVTLTPLFNTFILIASGYIFGGHIGLIINFLATSVGLFLIVFLVKRYGRPILKKFIPDNYYLRFDRIVQKVGPLTLLIVYVLPLTPDDELTYIVAAGPIGMKRFILPILIGTLAKSAYSYIGDLGAEGILIATYARVSLLVIGLLVVGLQEKWILSREVLSEEK